jgi:hypothetical protein
VLVRHRPVGGIRCPASGASLNVVGTNQPREHGRRGGLLLSTAGFATVLGGRVLSDARAVGVSGALSASLVLIVQIATVGLALRVAEAHRVIRAIAVGSISLAAAATLLTLAGGSDAPLGPAFAASALLYFVAPISVVRWIVRSGRVDRQTVLASVDAYLMIGMFFAFFYRAIAVAQAGPFFGSSGDGTMAQTLFFSFTTLTTTGYGNLVPAGNPGQTVAVFEMLLGQLFLVTAVAKVISIWQPTAKGSSAGRGE